MIMKTICRRGSAFDSLSVWFLGTVAFFSLLLSATSLVGAVESDGHSIAVYGTEKDLSANDRLAIFRTKVRRKK